MVQLAIKKKAIVKQRLFLTKKASMDDENLTTPANLLEMLDSSKAY
jgi:hypothetical protein